MPRLLMFAACERALVDQKTNVVSLMSLLQDINVHIPPNVPVPPPNAIIPMQWTIVSIFLNRPGDDGKEFETRNILVDKVGAQLVVTPVAVFSVKDQHRVISQINGMPIGSAGPLVLKCFLREKGSNEWEEMGEGFPLNIKWQSGAPSFTVH